MELILTIDGVEHLFEIKEEVTIKLQQPSYFNIDDIMVRPDDVPTDIDDHKYKKERNTWYQMINRCHNENNPRFHNYGGRGITVCDSWRESFRNFLDDMGRAPGPEYTIDRIDNDGCYNRENCRWVTRDVQTRNSRQNRYVIHNSERICTKDASDIIGITRGAFVIMRNKKGWTDQETFDYYMTNGKKSDTIGIKVKLLGREMYTNNAIKELGITPWSFYKLKKIMGVDNQTLVSKLASPKAEEVLNLLPYKPTIR